MDLNLCLIRFGEGWGLYDRSFMVLAIALMKPESFFFVRQFSDISEATEYT